MNAMSRLLNDMGGPWSVLVTTIILSVVPALLGLVIIRPISRVAGRLKSPTKFLLSDFFWLVIQLQLAMGYCVRFIGIENRAYFALIGGFLFLATVGMWAGAVSFMSRANVTVPSRRAVFILFVLPATMFLMMATSFIALMAADLTFEFATQDFRYGLSIMASWVHLDWPQILIGFALLPAICYGLRRCALWILTGVVRPRLPESVEETAPSPTVV